MSAYAVPYVLVAAHENSTSCFSVLESLESDKPLMISIYLEVPLNKIKKTDIDSLDS